MIRFTARSACVAGPLALAMAIAACVPRAVPPPAAPAPAPAAAPAPTPAPAPLVADWQDWPRTPGVWRYERDAAGTRAVFGLPGQPARALLRCDRTQRTLALDVPGATAPSFTIRTSATTRNVPARAGGSTPSAATATFAATDRLLDAMAFSRGRFTVEPAGQAPLVLPPWAEFGRVLEDCRG